jgi:thiol-disulfide isomerase/thioredoxin
MTVKRMNVVSPSSVLYRVLIFLAPLCPICQDMTYDLRLTEKEFVNAPVEFVGLFPNLSTRAEQIAEFDSIYGLSMPLQPDTSGWAERLGARWTPEVFVLDDQDSVVYRGRINDRYFAPGRRKSRTRRRDLHEALNELMAGDPVSVPHTDAVGCPIEGIQVPLMND